MGFTVTRLYFLALFGVVYTLLDVVLSTVYFKDYYCFKFEKYYFYSHLTKALPFDVVRLIVSKWLLQFSLPFIKLCFIMEQLIYDLVYILTPRYMLPT